MNMTALESIELMCNAGLVRDPSCIDSSSLKRIGSKQEAGDELLRALVRVGSVQSEPIEQRTFWCTVSKSFIHVVCSRITPLSIGSSRQKLVHSSKDGLAIAEFRALSAHLTDASPSLASHLIGHSA